MREGGRDEGGREEREGGREGGRRGRGGREKGRENGRREGREGRGKFTSYQVFIMSCMLALTNYSQLRKLSAVLNQVCRLKICSLTIGRFAG